MEENDNMDYFYQQVLQKDVSRRLQVGQELVDYLSDPHRSPDLEQDKPRLDKSVDELTGWVNSSHFKVRRDLLSVERPLRKGTAVSQQSSSLVCHPRGRETMSRGFCLLNLLNGSQFTQSCAFAPARVRARAQTSKGEESIYLNDPGWITRFIR